MDGFELNKLAAACLIALLLAKGGQEISKVLISPKELKENEHAYIVQGLEAGSSGGASVPAGPVAIEPLLANANIERGATLAKQCKQCHTFEKGGSHGIGPNLYGVVGGKMAHENSFAYSRTLAAMQGDWTFANLNLFLFKPREFINGTKMAFAGMRQEQDRADLIAYLNTLSDRPVPLPQSSAKLDPVAASASSPETPGVQKATPQPVAFTHSDYKNIPEDHQSRENTPQERAMV